MTTSKPFALDSKIYDQLHIDLCITSRTTNGVFSGSTCVTLKPYTILADGTEEFAPREYEKVIIIGDNVALAMLDPDVAKIVSTFSDAIQEFINKKGY